MKAESMKFSKELVVGCRENKRAKDDARVSALGT